MEKKPRYKDPELARIIVERIKQIRSESKASQESATDQAHADVYRYEAGRKLPNLMSIRKVCAFYNITIREFFDIDAFDYPPKTSKPVERMPKKK